MLGGYLPIASSIATSIATTAKIYDTIKKTKKLIEWLEAAKEVAYPSK